MLKNIFGYCVMFLLSASSAVADPDQLTVALSVTNSSVLISEPVSAQITLRNLGAKPVSILPLEAAGDHPNVSFMVFVKTEKHRVAKPELILEQVEGNLQRKVIALHSGETVTETFVLGIDWAFEKPIFQLGTNWLACAVTTLSGEVIQSEKQRIVVSLPINENERIIQRLLADKETLRAMYAADYLLLTKQPQTVVASMRQIAALDHAIAQSAKKTLLHWRKYEQEARAGRAPGLKIKGFDRLGLQDIDELPLKQ